MQNNDVVDDFDNEEEEIDLIYQFLLERCKTIPTLKGNGLLECLRRIADLLRLSTSVFKVWPYGIS